MPILPPSGPTETAISYSIADICNDALIEIGVASPGEPADPDEMQWAFRQSNYLLDTWEAMRKMVFTYNFTLWTLQAGLSPHTIGSSGVATFAVPQRPVRIESSALIFNISGSQIDLPMNIRDKEWWAGNKVKQIQTNVPTDLYYEPGWPDGSLYFWPVPNTGNQVRLQTWGVLSQFAQITDPIGGPGGPATQPPGYRAALMLTLAEWLLPGSMRPAHPTLERKALNARIALGLNNNLPPRIKTQDAGMPSRSALRGDFNWATGGRPGGPPE